MRVELNRNSIFCERFNAKCERNDKRILNEHGGSLMRDRLLRRSQMVN
jgi:hypothetical protein